MLKCKQEAYPCVAHEKGLQKSLVDKSAVTSLAYTLSHVPLHYENDKTRPMIYHKEGRASAPLSTLA